ncbi:MAG TPA: N-acetyltransferase [Candidatus Limnocylindria bacterium]|nr:N-acetyltransferase [Candidatus Limnocylindria bacterium]
MIVVRQETEADHPSVREINEAAFGGTIEADLVEALRKDAHPHLSLVAEREGRVVGHVFFSPATIDADAPFEIFALGPMAVRPEHQRQGIGSALIERGLEECRRLGRDVVLVLGHPTYYPRFGFRPAVEHGLRCEWPVPDDVFMVRELREGALSQRRGLVKYRPEFANV